MRSVRPVRTFWSTWERDELRGRARKERTYLEVREGRVHLHAPVDEAVGAVDDAIVVQPNERLGDCLGEVLVHRECDAIPIARDSEALNLARDALLVPAETAR